MIESKKASKEIGSSFWEVEKGGRGLRIIREAAAKPVFSLSGRTSLFQIIEDISKYRKLESVLLPSYCCDSMIEPFYRAGVRVRFYPVIVGESSLEMDLSNDYITDAIFTMAYFGMGIHNRDAFEKRVKRLNPNAVIIRDVTHSLLSERDAEGAADYIFASLRKWTGLKGGGVILKAPRQLDKCGKRNDKYEKTVSDAMRLKEKYLDEGIGHKADFLSLFAEGEEILNVDYEGYACIEEDCKDIAEFNEEIVSLRRVKNYHILSDAEEAMMEKGIKPLLGRLEDSEVPLFFPVIFESSKDRDDFRVYMTKNEVYCPVHWPISDLHVLAENEKEIYERELSMVCDQRYGSNDMERIIELIKRY